MSNFFTDNKINSTILNETNQVINITPILESNPLIINTSKPSGLFEQPISFKDLNNVFKSVTNNSIADSTIDFTKIKELKSLNFARGSDGFFIEKDGSAEFNDVVVRGTIESGSILSGNISVGNGTDINGIVYTDYVIGAGNAGFEVDKTDFGYEQTGAIMGIDDADGKAKFYVNSGSNHLAFNGVDIETQGTLIASTIFKIAIYSVADLPIPETAVGFNSPTNIA